MLEHKQYYWLDLISHLSAGTFTDADDAVLLWVEHLANLQQIVALVRAAACTPQHVHAQHIGGVPRGTEVDLMQET